MQLLIASTRFQEGIFGANAFNAFNGGVFRPLLDRMATNSYTSAMISVAVGNVPTFPPQTHARALHVSSLVHEWLFL